ncbi:MAG TPA: MmcQ/YjbR family DNA-binding protein [Bryobacteraceae bacterium]|nr:MmcQ/YjbR family DNA-binding protein [Bryobacteraceae bacterium]
MDKLRQPRSTSEHTAAAEDNLRRLRRICSSFPGMSERLSHGEPTFFAGKRVFAMFSNHHHNDGHLAVWIPAAPGVQEALVASSPRKFYRPPYVGVRGWVGVELDQVDDDELGQYLTEAWQLITRAGQPRLKTEKL